jgi:hypothetical protein
MVLLFPILVPSRPEPNSQVLPFALGATMFAGALMVLTSPGRSWSNEFQRQLKQAGRRDRARASASPRTRRRGVRLAVTLLMGPA